MYAVRRSSPVEYAARLRHAPARISTETPMSRSGADLWKRLGPLTGCTPAALSIVVSLIIANIMLVNFHRQLFPRVWRYVMWEGGVVENLTALNFVLGAVVFVTAAASRRVPTAHRRWFLVFALACLVLAGEEVNYGEGMLILNLEDPEFASRYNPQHGSLHNLAPAFVPILAFFLLMGGVRIFYRRIQQITRVPVPLGFFNAVLLTAAAVPFMRLGDNRYLFVDEVFEWSSSFLIFCLALHSCWGWFFLRSGERR